MSLERRLGRSAFAGVIFFAAACGAAQFLRSDLDWVHAPLSYYLVGPGGTAIKVAYFVLSAAIAAVGGGCYRALQPGARSAAPLLLFILAAIALEATALFDTASRPGDPSLHAFLHNVAAETTFLSICTAMLLQAWRFRHDRAWRQHSAFALSVAVVTFIALLVYALTHIAPRGLMQKSVIVLILIWLGSAAGWLMRTGR